MENKTNICRVCGMAEAVFDLNMWVMEERGHTEIEMNKLKREERQWIQKK